MAMRVRVARTLLLVWVALYVAHQLGFCGPPFGADTFESLFTPLTF